MQNIFKDNSLVIRDCLNFINLFLFTARPPSGALIYERLILWRLPFVKNIQITNKMQEIVDKIHLL